MKNLIIVCMVLLLCGCGTKTKQVESAFVYISNATIDAPDRSIKKYDKQIQSLKNKIDKVAMQANCSHKRINIRIDSDGYICQTGKSCDYCGKSMGGYSGLRYAKYVKKIYNKIMERK